MGGNPVGFAGLSNLIIRTGFAGTPLVSKDFWGSYATFFKDHGGGFPVFGRVNHDLTSSHASANTSRRTDRSRNKLAYRRWGGPIA